MKVKAILGASVALIAILPVQAVAQDVAATSVEDSAATEGEIIVTARKREETLLDVPVAISAVSGDTIERRGYTSVRDIASQTPGLNITSDGTGRAFVSIRGVGVTLVQSVQPGVGLFIDGVYQPNTSYLNNPLVDVERIEVLRGPQGTLYGKNTLGGAINVISRQPSNELQVRALASYAGPDDSWLVSGSISGAIVEDKLQVRIAGAHRQQDGFLNNILIGGKANRYNSDSVNGSIRFLPAEDVTLTINGYYDWVDGVNTPYARVSGPTDYSRSNEFNTIPNVQFKYRGVNAKLQLPIDGINTTVTAIAAYDLRNGRTTNADVDFGPLDFARASGNDSLRTKTAELRFDTELSDTLSSLIGLFYSRETTNALDVTSIAAFGLTRTTTNATKADSYAVFGTLFWKPNTDWEVALGMRYDHEDRRANGSIVTQVGAATIPSVIPPVQIKSNEVEPRLTVTRKWNDEFMVYASVARGYRGGGFNAPTAPIRTYKGDSAWTYEIGSKYVSPDRNVTVSGALFYNDYKDYIGLNSIAPAAGGGLVTVDLNTGDVESYGMEIEARFRPTPEWTLSGGITYSHARITDARPYTAVTGRTLSSDRLTFQPDWNFSANSDYAIPVGDDDTLTLSAGLVGKGSRLAATLNETTPTVLKAYFITNLSASYSTGPVEFSVFANNLFNEDYFDSYIEKTTLQLAGLPASDLGIIGERRRIGARVRFQF